MPRLADAVGSVRAKTMNRSATGALVMYRLAPPRTQPSPSRTAAVVMPEGSEPASASVRAKLATTSPEAMGGNHSAFWASLPPSMSTWPAIPLLVPNIERRAGVV